VLPVKYDSDDAFDASFDILRQGSAKICTICEIYFQKGIAGNGLSWYVHLIEQSASIEALSV
jgi:hypothetical protein